MKHIVATVLPVFRSQGRYIAPEIWIYEPPAPEMTLWGPVAIPAVLLLWPVSIAPPRSMSLPQKYVLAVIVISAAVHFSYFRDRTLHLAQIGFILFVVASPWLLASINGEAARRRVETIKLLAVALAIAGALAVKGIVDDELVERRANLADGHIEVLLDERPGSTTPEIAERVLEENEADD